MAEFESIYDIELVGRRNDAKALLQPIGEGDAHGMHVGARVTKNGTDVNLGGQCVGKVIRADGATVPLTGSIIQNLAYVTLDQQSCAVPGPIQVAVMWVSGTNVTTLVIAYGAVVNTTSGTIIQPSAPIPDLTQLLAEIEAMRQATAAANAAAEKSVRHDITQNLTPAQMKQARDNIEAGGEFETNAAGSYLLNTDLFQRGSLDHGNITETAWRVVLKKISRTSFPVTLVAQDGFQFGVQTYNASGAYSSDTGWKTTYTIPKNTYFRITIARVTENTGETANIATFVAGVHIQTGTVRYNEAQDLTAAEQAQARGNIGAASAAAEKSVRHDITQNLTPAQMKQARDNIEAGGEFETNAAGSYLLNTDLFQRGSLDHGNITETAWRVVLKKISRTSFPVTLVAQDGFQFGVQTYNASGAYSSDTGWKTTYTIPKNTYFRITIARVTENTGETANIATFVAGVHIQTGTVRYNEAQDLTAAEQAQARGNIGAASATELAAEAAVREAADTDLKSALNYEHVPNDLTWTIGTLSPGTGAESASPTRVRSPYIFANAGDKITLSSTSPDCLIVYCFGQDKAYLYDTAWDIHNTYTVPEQINSKKVGYVRLLIRKSGSNPSIDPSEIDDLVAQCTISRVIPNSVYSMDLTLYKINNIQNSINGAFAVINRFNKSTITEGKYISIIDGGLSSNSQFFASDYIYVGDLSAVNLSYTHIVGFYDANKLWLGAASSMDSNSTDLTVSVPSNAVYLRFSTYNTHLDVAQIGKYVTRSNYVAYGMFYMPDLRVKQSQVISDDSRIVVDASGSGDYTSLTEALYENVNTEVDIVVKPGIYDIVSEYVALFGQEAVDNMADSESSIFNGFQYGIIIRNRTITFETGAYVVCDWTGHTVDGVHRFSAIRVDYNCKIIGLNLVATATFYAIHDDYGLGTHYTVEYENCYVEGVNLVNANCIGGGCKKYSRHVIKNCYFNNHLTGRTNATVRYHNTNANGAVPEIYVSNCYFSNSFQPRYYGSQTSKMKVYVNNCEAVAIFKAAESSSFTVDNVDLYKWCNTETNPVT